MNDRLVRQMSLFPSDGEAALGSQDKLIAPPRTGRLVTNHLNLMYMLAAGLLMPPSGFGGKHYHDTLAAFPGWLPLFVGRSRQSARARRAAIDDSTAEAKYLRGILLEVDLADLEGPVRVFSTAAKWRSRSDKGGWCERRLEEGIGRGEWLVLVPAPLPVSRIKRILFRSVEDKREVETAAEERSNVPLAAYSRRTQPSLFEGARDERLGSWCAVSSPTMSWPTSARLRTPPDEPGAVVADRGREAGGRPVSIGRVPEPRDVDLPAAQAAGGVLAVLHKMANMASAGDLSVWACRAAFDPVSEFPDHPTNLLGLLPLWMQNGGAGHGPRDDRQATLGRILGWMQKADGPEAAEPAEVTEQNLFWRSVQRLVENRRKPDGRSPEDAIISCLRASSEPSSAKVQLRLPEEGIGDLDEAPDKRVGDLVSTLDALGGGLGGGTVSEMLDRHPTPLARAAILFLLRQRTQELLELVGAYPQIEELDRLAAAILFGVRDGWLKMPIALRGSKRLTAAVTHRMAALAHRLDESGFNLGEAPLAPDPALRS